MYLSKIDDLLDKLIDDFFSVKFKEDNKFKKILTEINFVKFQKELNELMKSYYIQMNLTDIDELFKNSEIKIKITETIKRYLTIYMFLYIGYFYTSADSTFMNNIVEFTKNQPEYQFKIDNFFNSESNALIIRYHQMIKRLINYIEADTPQKKDILTGRTDYTDVIKFKNELTDDFFKLAYFDVKDKSMKAHNIIKTIILFDIYRSEKKDLYKLIELFDNAEGEFMFIDIVMPTKETIDFKNIELLLSKKDLVKGMAYVLWDYIAEYDNSQFELGKSNDEKISELFESGIVVPIVDDFLLYHKDSERYDKNIVDKVKKKEDTKIRYIINKIDSVANINNVSNKSEVKKLFYAPLNNKKAIIVNNNEDMKIITKFINQGNISSENSELLKDLENYTIYPYVNFKDSENGIHIGVNKTIDVVRAVSFEKEGDFKQRFTHSLQMRIGSVDQLLNIVGLFIPATNSSPYCIKNGSVKNIRDLGESKNGFGLASEFLAQTVIADKNSNMSVYWLFDNTQDNIELDTYEQQNKFSKEDIIKHILAKFYDRIIEEIYEEINKKFEEIKKSEKILTVNKIIDIIDSYQKNKINITKDKKIKELLEDKICIDIAPRSEAVYDINDDMVYGLAGDIIKLDKINNNDDNNKNILKISTEFIEEKGIYEEQEKIEGVCQHNITWDRLSELKKMDPTLFIDELYAFLQTYVIENADHNYVCKSCGFHLNIKKYVQDGKFDDSSQRFIVYGMPLDTPLEDISEYEKYRGSIRSIDKFIEKIALISNISYFMGSSPTVKSRRKLIVKDSIDIIINNNNLLKNIYKQRNENISKTYGIANSNLFVFDLDNSIFIFSSKDKDYLKPLKQNNILGYIIFLVILELNETQISYINLDKKGFCNFQVFDKIYSSLFEGIKLRKNNKGDTVQIKNYPILCYVLYMLSCYLTKYNLWYYDYKEDIKDKTKKQKFIPIIQKIIINTIVDIINSIIENKEESKNIIFEILVSKFYNKLNTTFGNMDLYNKFKAEISESLLGESKQFILTKQEAYVLTGKYLNKSYEPPFHWRKYTFPKMYIDIKKIHRINYDRITNLSNCETGTFHTWVESKDIFECKICGVKSNELKLSEQITQKIVKNYELIRLRNLLEKMCIKDGKFHIFYFDDKKNKNICLKCHNSDKHIYDDKELFELDKIVNKEKLNLTKKTLELTEQNIKIQKENISYSEKLISKLIEKYNQNITKDNKYKYIDDLITIIENNLGEDLTKQNIFIRNNAYIFDHDYLGNPLSKPIVITDKENKINFKASHPFFNTDVIYYTSYKNGKIDVFYDSTSRVLLGYKEENKNPVINKNYKKMININYSLMNKIKLMGYSSQYIDLNEMKKDYFREYINDIKINDKDQDIKNELIKNIIRNRHTVLKNIIYKFQRVIIRLINAYVTPKKETDNDKDKDRDKDNIKEDLNYFINKLDSIVDEYRKKISSINISSDTGSHQLFKHWKGICEYIQLENDKEISKNIDTISYEEINNIDTKGNMLLFYIINEFKSLLDFNNNKIIKTNLCLLLIDFINIIFEFYNEEKYKYNMEYKQFYYFIHSATYIDEIKDTMGEKQGIYEEYIDENKEITEEEKNALEDAEEEDGALDIEEDEIDYASMYDRNFDREPREDFKDFDMSYRDYKNILSIYDYYDSV